MILEDKRKVKVRDVYLNTPLHLAASFQNKDVLRFLIRHGADLDALNHDGYTL